MHWKQKINQSLHEAPRKRLYLDFQWLKKKASQKSDLSQKGPLITPNMKAYISTVTGHSDSRACWGPNFKEP